MFSVGDGIGRFDLDATDARALLDTEFNIALITPCSVP